MQSLTTLVLQARLAPIPRLPTHGAFHAHFHITWRLCFCLLEVGITEVGHRYVLDLAASHLCFTWHGKSRCSFLRDFDLFLKLRVEEFPGNPHFSWDNSRVELDRQIRLVFAVITVRPSVSVCLAKGKRVSKFALSRSCCLL